MNYTVSKTIAVLKFAVTEIIKYQVRKSTLRLGGLIAESVNGLVNVGMSNLESATHNFVKNIQIPPFRDYGIDWTKLSNKKVIGGRTRWDLDTYGFKTQVWAIKGVAPYVTKCNCTVWALGTEKGFLILGPDMTMFLRESEKRGIWKQVKAADAQRGDLVVWKPSNNMKTGAVAHTAVVTKHFNKNKIWVASWDGPRKWDKYHDNILLSDLNKLEHKDIGEFGPFKYTFENIPRLNPDTKR